MSPNLPILTGTLALLIALSSSAVSAQQATPATPPRDARPVQTGTGAIRGRVTASDTTTPLRRVQVRLMPMTAAGVEGRVATTGDDGRYEFTQLPPGRYGLTASKAGYVDIEYGQRRPFEKGRPIELSDKQVLDRIDLTLPAGAVITGRVADETGEPVARAYVQLARYRYTGGKRQLAGMFGDSTDDRGEFRIFGVPPAEYFLYADFGDNGGRSVDRIRYVRTFFPGTSSVAEAQRVRVKLGEELSGLSVMLTRQRTASISGVLRSATSAPSPFTLVSARSDEDSDWRTGVAGPDGAFSITGVLPGSYIVEAQSAFGNERATTEMKVSGTDVVGIVLTLSSGASARGQVRFESATPPRDLQPSQLLLFAAPEREGGFSVDMPRPPVRSDWTFELTGLHGRQVLSGGTISGWHVKKVTVGGNDFTDSPIDFSNGDVNGIEVLLSNRSSEVTGQVTDSRGAMAGDASVVIFPADSNLWTGRRRYITASRPDQQGRFSIMGLPAARYLAIALDYLEEGEEYDPDLLKEWARLATSFTLGDGEARTVNLKISQSN